MTKEEALKILTGYMGGKIDPESTELYHAIEFAVDILESRSSLPSNLDEAAEEYFEQYNYMPKGFVVDAFKAGAEWQIEQFEKNRLAACDAQTKEEYDMETAFVDKIIKEQHRTPTFSDAIKHGIEWMAGQGETFECSIDWYDGPFLDFSEEQLYSAIVKAELEVGDKVVVQIRKK